MAFTTLFRLKENLNLDNKYLQNLKKKYDVIAIDEAQFFNDLYNFVNICLDMEFHVIVCGLNGNYK